MTIFILVLVFGALVWTLTNKYKKLNSLEYALQEKTAIISELQSHTKVLEAKLKSAKLEVYDLTKALQDSKAQQKPAPAAKSSKPSKNTSKPKITK